MSSGKMFDRTVIGEICRFSNCPRRVAVLQMFVEHLVAEAHEADEKCLANLAVPVHRNFF